MSFSPVVSVGGQCSLSVVSKPTAKSGVVWPHATPPDVVDFRVTTLDGRRGLYESGSAASPQAGERDGFPSGRAGRSRSETAGDHKYRGTSTSILPSCRPSYPWPQ